jgi:E3 Ubiquitin ligase
VDDEWKLRLLLGAVAAGSFWFWFVWWKKARLIDDTPRSRIRSAAQGYVELRGRGQLPASQPNLAPLTRRPCVWWMFKIERYESSGKSSHWRTVNSGTSTVPFLLHDEDQWCVVNPTGAEVFPGDRSIWRGDSAWPQSGPQGERVRAFGSGAYRYTEHRIYEQEQLDVIGEFRSVGGVQSIDKEEALSTLLRQWKEDQAALMQRFDDNRDGVLSAAEWERARTAARQEIDQRLLAETPSSYSVVMRTGDDRPFLIAACDLAKVARRYRLYAIGAVVAFVASVYGLASSFLG